MRLTHHFLHLLLKREAVIPTNTPEPIVEKAIVEEVAVQENTPQPEKIEEPVPSQDVQVTPEPIVEEIHVESIKEEPTPAPIAPKVNPHQKTFDSLVKKIYDRDYDLGSCFENNITFESFEENKLTWGSHAEGDDKKMLITHWGLINMFVKDTFGFETKIVNVAKKKVVDTSLPSTTSTSSVTEGKEAEISETSVPEPVEGSQVQHILMPIRAL